MTNQKKTIGSPPNLLNMMIFRQPGVAVISGLTGQRLHAWKVGAWPALSERMSCCFGVYITAYNKTVVMTVRRCRVESPTTVTFSKQPVNKTIDMSCGRKTIVDASADNLTTAKVLVRCTN